jgi:hypothetical protein
MVPIIAFTHYAIRDFAPNCAELIRGFPAASPPSLLLASVSTRGRGRIRLVAGKADRSKCRKTFFQCRRTGSLSPGGIVRNYRDETVLPNLEEAELLAKGTGESYSTAPNGSTPH